jgi:uncharacterized protein
MPEILHFDILFDPGETTVLASDCDCACPVVQSMPNEHALHPSDHLQRHPQQQVLPLTSEHVVAFVPSFSRVTVLNGAALDLLERFSAPQPLEPLNDAEQGAARRLYACGLLHTDECTNLPPPADELSVWLHVTNACNLRCTYCYIDKTDEAMGTDTAFAAIDTVLRVARLNNYRSVLLKYAGGEASLNLSLVEQMQHYAQEQAHALGFNVQGRILSNGVGLTRHKLQRIRSIGMRLMISLDGPQETHDRQRPRLGGQGSYQAVLASIKRARAMGLDLTVSITVTGESIDGLPMVVRWLLAHEVHFTINFYRECHTSTSPATLQMDEHRLIAGLRAAYSEIEQHPPRYSLLGCLLDRSNLGAPHQHTCAAGKNYLVIDHQGRVSACQMEIDHTITTIEAEDPLAIIRQNHSGLQNLAVTEKEGCRDCTWKYWCTGGCPLATFRATGRYDVQSPNCGIYQALYPDVVRLEGLRLLYWRTQTTPASC